jgi:hypothetical protein
MLQSCFGNPLGSAKLSAGLLKRDTRRRACGSERKSQLTGFLVRGKLRPKIWYDHYTDDDAKNAAKTVSFA